MNKQLFLFLVLSGLILPLQVNAIALGPIEVESKMFEPLQARIPVLAETNEALDKLTYRLIPTDNETDHSLSDPETYDLLHLKLRQNIDGSAYITIKSSFLIKDSVLDFSVEFEWPGGRSLRQYSILLDPPEQKFAVSALQSQGVDRRIIQVEPSKTEARVIESTSQSGIVHLAKGRPIAIAPPQKLTRMENGVLVYGPIPRNDSLVKIAETIRPSPELTLTQIMLSLYEQNPAAFTQNNINRLKAGYTLKINNPGRIGQISQQEATTLLNEYIQGRTSDADNNVQMVKTISADTRQLTDKNTNQATLKQRLHEIKKDNQSHESENDFLRDKIKRLEEFIPSLQDLLKQKNEKLSELNVE